MPTHPKHSHVVVTATKKVHQVLWVGTLDTPRGPKEVYQLDNGYWDCYYLDELFQFGSPPIFAPSQAATLELPDWW